MKSNQKSLFCQNSKYILVVFLFLFVPQVFCAPYHKILVDGDLGDWSSGEKIVNDSSDGEFLNRIDALFVTWDGENLYLGINHKVDGNGLLLYLDKNYGSSEGYDDLTQIDTWNKKAKFSAAGFRPDFQYGSWDGDSGNFYKITSATSVIGVSADCKTDFGSDISGTEISVAWADIFPAGFPANAKIAIFCSICDGSSLTGDHAPDNISVSLPEVDSCAVVECDTDGNGVPDRTHNADFFINYVKTVKIFSPNGDGINDNLNIAVSVNQPAMVTLRVFSIEGKKVFQNSYNLSEAGETPVSWNGLNCSGQWLPNGIYILNIRAVNSAGEETYKNEAVAIVK